MMKRSVLALTMGAAVYLMSFNVSHAAATLSVGTEGDAPPYSMADANGHVTGYDADVANAVCSQLKMSCHFVVQSFDTLIPSLSAGRFDVIVSGLGITDAREKQIDYSIPYGASTEYFVARKGSPVSSMTSLDAVEKGLTGKRVGVVNGTTYAKFIEKFISNANIKTYDSVNELLSDLQSKRLDAAFSDAPTWSDFLKTPGGSAFVRVPVPVHQSVDPSTLGRGMGVGIRKGNAALQKQVDGALCTLIKNGTLTKISEKWFQEDYTIPCKS